MKLYMKYAVALAIASVISGCTVTKVPVSVVVPGKMKLHGISKIAVVDFNSLPDDPLTGIFCADKNTVEIAQQMVAGAFFKNRFYKVSDLNVENFIKNQYPNAQLAQRFDAILYGRVWWQVSPEISGTYPKVFTLEKWSNVKYQVPYTEKYPVYKTAKVTDSTNDVLTYLPYRAWNVNLMVSLQLYRLRSNGKLEKMTEIFTAAHQDFILNNGEFSQRARSLSWRKRDQADRLQAISEKKSFFSIEEKKQDVKGEVGVSRSSCTIPTQLQGKMVLNEVLSKRLVSMISPSKKVFNVIIDFDDDKLFELLKNESYYGARRYIINKVLSEGDSSASKHFNNGDFDKACEVMVKKSDPGIDAEDIADANAEFVEDKKSYIYALGICEEAIGNYEKALYTYRYVFNVDPDKRLALGISRCLLALGMRSRLNEQQLAKVQAKRKTKLR